ncbi:ZIP family metal transporter [Halegenticoccus tardaugens]|uniref:ZIP family metal transporter n=1 Tax=Halegenticoccus tardaugens TaxID=2071624 RepID=UPI00100A3EE0|nr:ZIP family metal transporter [Halegenticoccus tardaugens]
MNVVLFELAFVFVAGLFTALATGVGAIPFFFVDDLNARWNVVLWGVASGIMLSASVFGLLTEGLANGTPFDLAVGFVAGVALVIVAHAVVEGYDVHPRKYEEASYRKLLLILGVLTVHSFPEGVAVGVSFADFGLVGADSVSAFGVAVPVLAAFMTVAISIHNVPEGVAVSIPLRAMGVSNWKLVWWAVFSSLPQPIGAVVAFYFVSVARDLVAAGFGFAAGAMIYLVASEFIPEALDLGRTLPGGGRRELLSGLAVGFALMVPLAFL